MMDDTRNYVVDSLELHLFFARIMREHALFLRAGLLPPNGNLAAEAENYRRQFEQLLSRATALSDQVVRRCVLDGGEVFTEFTQRAERQTQRFTGIPINTGLTARQERLRGRDCGDRPVVTDALCQAVRRLNREGLRLVDGLIDYKTRLLRGVTDCRLFTGNYPLLIEHIRREAQLYRASLLRLEGMDGGQPENSELFWNQIMMEHALFIRGLLDPSQAELIDTADDFAGDYRRLLETASAANDCLTPGGDALALTCRFRDFKRAGVEGIENCQIRSIILPLLADHVLREANHYIRLLKKDC